MMYLQNLSIAIYNKFDKDLHLVGQGVDQGVWSDDEKLKPKDTILAGQDAECNSESNGPENFMKGWLTYSIANGVDFGLQWDTSAANYGLSAQSPPGYRVDCAAIPGDNIIWASYIICKLWRVVPLQ